MNAYAELTLVVYLLAVLFAKNEIALIDELKKETGFFKWAIALGLVIVVADQFDKAGATFITLVYVAMALTAVKQNPKVFDNLTQILRG